MKNHHNFRLPFSLAFFTFACLAFACFAADWPQFKRTPDRQGCNLAEQVTLPANLCAWADFGSPILGSPVVAAGRAYCMAQNGLIACIDLASNTVVWHRSLGGQSNECTPAVGNGKVYVGSTAGKFFVLDAADGAILEEHDVGGMVFAPVLLLNTGVYVGTYGGIFYAFDPDGNLKWTDTAQLNIKHGAAFGRGQIIYVDGNTNMVFLEDSGTYCKETRKITLELADNSSVTGWVNTPMVWRDTVFAAFSEAEMYYSQHNLLLYNIVTGAYIKYISHNGVGGGGATVSATPSVDTATGGLFCATANGGLFAPGWGTIAVYSSYPYGLYAVNSSPAVVGNCVVFGSEVSSDTGGCAIHFYAKTSGNTYGGTQLWSYRPASNRPVSSSPAVSDGRAVVGSLDGCLYGFWNGTEVTAPVVIDSGSTISGRPGRAPGQWTLSVFPNPSSSQYVQFTAKGLEPGAVLSVYDIRGALVQRLKAGHGMVWNTAGIASGSYIAMLRDRSGKSLKSFNIRILK
jgi:outer membrane protein assembly factor BamB